MSGGTQVAQLPDGTELEFPSNTPMSVIQAKVRELLNPKDQTTKGEVFNRQALGGLVDNLVGVPNVMANAGMRAVNDLVRPIQHLGESAAAIRHQNFNHFSHNPRLAEADASKSNPLVYDPDLSERTLPLPTSNDVFAGAQVLGEMAGRAVQTFPGNNNSAPLAPISSLDQARANQQQITDTGRQEHGGHAFAGDIAGDVAALTMLRAPVAKQRALGEMASKTATDAAKTATSGYTLGTAPTVMQGLESAFSKSTRLRTLANRAGRSAEAGFEGAAISLLNEGDPLETAAYSAGSQAMGSMLLGGTHSLFKGDLVSAAMNLGASAFAIGSVLQLAKSGTPGGENFILDSIESGYDKVLLGIALGGLSAVGGMGRVTSGFSTTALPRVADAISSVPRAGVISVIQEITNDQQSQQVLEKVMRDPSAFSSAATRILQRAINNEKVSFSGAVDHLMENREFRNQFEAIQ